jgi:hypothetical protein
MAIYTADQAQSTIQPKTTRVGLTAVTSFWSVVNSLSATSTIQMIKVPQGATPVYLAVACTNNGDSSFLVGDGNSTGRFKAIATLSAGLGFVICNLPAPMYTYSVDDTIDILVSTASATTLGGALYLTAIFSMDIKVPNSF